MATYLQGVTDYIPQLQPFQPDLNLYANVLQTKQTQYDNTWKALNNIYSQYFYADLTRDGNVKRKEELMKNIEFNLRRVSGLDLSLSQNIDQATQVFKPFYEDTNLMKDMAWTKNYKGQVGKAESLKNSSDEARQGQYWDVGLRELEYRRDEFKNASDEEALSFDNVSYTPYVNVIKKANKIAKDSGLSIETVDFSPDGRWIVKTKNGEALMEPLSKLFEAELGSDPGVQAVYKSQAYVNRKDYAFANAAQFNGDKNAAEMKYLENQFNILKDQQVARYNQMQDQSNVYDNKIKDLEDQVAKGNKSPSLLRALENMKASRDINNKVLERVKKDVDNLESSSKTPATGGSFVNPYGDINSLRYKVDNGVAGMLMEKDLNEAAYIFSNRDSKKDIQANPYAVNDQKHSHAMQQIAARNAGLLKAVAARNAGERKNNQEKHLLESGAAYLDANGNVVINEALNTLVKSGVNDGNVTGAINLKSYSRKITEERAQSNAVPYLKQTLNMLQTLQDKGLISKEEVKKVLNGKQNKHGFTIESFNQRLDKNAKGLLNSTLGPLGVDQLRQRMDWWIKNNSKVRAVASEIPGYEQLTNDIKLYTTHVRQTLDWYKESSKVVEQQLKARLDPDIARYAKFLYDDNGMMRSVDEFNKMAGIKGNNKQALIANKRNELKNYLLKKYNTTSYESAVKQALREGDARTKTYSAEIRKLEKEVGGFNLMEATNVSKIYNQLKSEAGKIYTSTSGVKVKTPPGLADYGTMSGSGLFTVGRSSIEVAPKAKHTLGYQYYNQMMGDILALDPGDISQNKFTFNGANKSVLDKANVPNAQAIRAILQAAYNESRDPKTKMNNFNIEVQPIAGANADLSSLVIHLDPLFLKQFVKTGKDNTGPGILTQQQYDAAVRNGLTVTSKKSNFSNDMLKAVQMSPLQSIIEYNPEGYKMESLYGNGSWQIKKNPILGGYTETISATYEDGSTGESYTASDTYPSNVNPDMQWKQMQNAFQMMAQQSMNIGYGGQ